MQTGLCFVEDCLRAVHGRCLVVQCLCRLPVIERRVVSVLPTLARRRLASFKRYVEFKKEMSVRHFVGH